MYRLSADRLKDLFLLISQDRALYAPLEQNGQLNFKRWTKDTGICLEKLHTEKSPKDLFFPQSENLVAFKTEGKKISIIDNREEIEPFVLFGVRACDAASFSILDRVFLSEPVDTYYKSRRDKGTVVTLACNEPEETCFCQTFGIHPARPAGDVSAWLAGDMLYWKSLTEKGEALTEKLLGLLEKCGSEDEQRLKKHQMLIDGIMDRLPLRDLKLDGFDGKALDEKFNSPAWAELSQACIGCGTCTFVCPTCQCYDIRDYDTGNGIQRFRCWDSCMYSDFTKMAHGNPRTSRVERFRQRFMHKLVYFPANNEGVYSCVGCGRCLGKCPVSMNIVKVVKTMGVKRDVQL